MEFCMNKKVIDRIDNLVNSIKNSNEYKEYIEILSKVNSCDEINTLTNDIKKLNKELVKKPSVELELLLKNKEKELNSIPLYLEYKYKLEDLNNLLLVVKNRVDNFVSELIIG